MNLFQVVTLIQILKGWLISVPIGKLSLEQLDKEVQVYNRGEDIEEERDTLSEDFDIPAVEENNKEEGDLIDLVDLDVDFVGEEKKERQQEPDLIDLGEEIIIEPTVVKKEDPPLIDLMDDVVINYQPQDTQQQNNQQQPEDVNFFGEEIAFDNKPVEEKTVEPVKPVETVNVVEEVPTVETNEPIQQPSQSKEDNPYSFLDNVQHIETIKAFQTKKEVEIEEEDEFVESDVNYAAPTKTHFFENQDIILQYSKQNVE